MSTSRTMPSDGDDDRAPLGREEITFDRDIRAHKYAFLALRRCRRGAGDDEAVIGRDIRDQLTRWFGERPEDQTVYNSLTRLADLGLISKEPAGRAKDYRITDCGRRVMQCFGWDDQERRIDIDTSPDE